MPLHVEVHPTTASRPCDFCLCLEGGSVFADFEVTETGRISLRRISFDGYGCCEATFQPMSHADSEFLRDWVGNKSGDEARLDMLLRRYFGDNSPPILNDALVDHQLL